MLDLPDLRSQLAALDQPLGQQLHTLLSACIRHALAHGLGTLTHVLVIEPGDTEADIVEAVGFSPLVSGLDGERMRSDWDWISQHEGWWELVYCVGNDGFAFILLVPDTPGILPELLELCRRGAAPSL